MKEDNNMDYSNIIVDVLLSDNVKLKPTQLGKNMKDILSYHLRKKYEGLCYFCHRPEFFHLHYFYDVSNFTE